MNTAPHDCRWIVVSMGVFCTAVLALAGCNDSVINSGIAHSGDRAASSQVEPDNPPIAEVNRPDSVKPEGTSDQADGATPPGTATEPTPTTPDDPARPRTFPVEGP